MDDVWMRRALELAAHGRGAVEPNPMVGAVVLDAAGQFVGEGWHQRYGGPHAEVFALAAAGDAARGGTLYVTLEPCCHHGKTPPCTDAVLRSGVRRVVAAMGDPFSRVAGGGIGQLRATGLSVEVGLLEAEARALNAPYLKRLATGRPWVHLKWAMTLDGRIATRTGDSQWISGPESRALVHQLRGRMDAILIGRGTLEADDPLLTARPPGPRTPTRVVVTASGRLPSTCQLLTTPEPVRVYSGGPVVGWPEVVRLPTGDTGLSVDAILTDLGQRGATNVLVEGGAGLLGAFVDAGAADELHVFVGPTVVGGPGLGPVGGRGVAKLTEALRLADVRVTAVGADAYIHGRISHRSEPAEHRSETNQG